MAKEVIFKIGNSESKAAINVVDRDKVYGWTEDKYTDANGELCRWATLLDDGKTIVASGGTALKTVDTAGHEVSKTQLVAIGLDGNPATLLPSVFDGVINLDNTKTVSDYLSMDVKNVYQLAFIEGLESVSSELKKSKVLYFPFNYRAGYTSDDAFLVPQGEFIFAVVGQIKNFEYMGLALPVAVEIEVQEDDDLDFNML